MTSALFLLFGVAFGHAALWVEATNRVHATGWSHQVANRISLLLFAGIGLGPIALACWAWFVGPQQLLPWSDWNGDLGRNPAVMAFKLYEVLCLVAALRAAGTWLIRHGLWPTPRGLRHHRSRSMTSRESLSIADDHPQHFLVNMPGNQALSVDLTERGIELERLPPALDGLSIVHLSDFHFTGRIAKPFFEEVCRLSNTLDPDLVLITGDLVDRTECIAWVNDTFGKLKARWGIYFILGNHDTRCDTRQLLETLQGFGIVYVGGRTQVIDVRGEKILLAGNELPWIGPAADLSSIPSRDEAPFRLFLSHSPDQLAWARDAECDLLLAGHTHGGQIRLPWIGPIFAPSMAGVAYASGLFHVGRTIMNVSRGLSGELPLRVNCAPEMIHLTLHASIEK